MSAGTGDRIRVRVCVDCGMRINCTLQQAKRHGWSLWVGGARCKGCRRPDEDDR